ncbi:MAG: ATP-binding protein [Bacteroidota bacterium]
MQSNSRGIALLIASCVGIITIAFLSLVPKVDFTILMVAFLLSFSSCYILTMLILDFLFYREINNIYKALRKSKELQPILEAEHSSWNPLKIINSEISKFAKRKNEEIENLREKENFRREFIADVSHELKTPLFSAQGFVHTLLDGAINDKEVRKKFLKKAARSLDALDLLVQDILTISQLESGEIKMHFENFDILELSKEVIDQMDGKAEKKGVEIAFDQDYVGPIIVRGDYRRIYQVMLNLISNAIKYTRKGGTAIVSFKTEKDFISVSVKDTGRGIPQEHLHRIFERFYRVEKSRSREKGGTGLGLSIVKHILEGHQTAIQVHSESRKGSEFTFSLEKAATLDRLGEDLEDEYADE